jgi:antitoxin HicB
MKSYQFTVVIEPDEDAFHAFVPSLAGCHTFGMTVDEARANILEAVGLHLECMLEDGETIPTETQSR